ncbi:ecotin [Dysgonomonas sp. PFB1-18]|uniref:serine protease inhibitor ecotin n=1 Tax=unclassified Dysgonomonas TaxID=2630389 RepID=UPI002476AD08|nr:MULTISPECIES: serine protease inhibitor ecotin [unclassified Dysgonomonas]MDH6308545.1 ecotin [Dysgonomonas sp. PF1-14]MDH6338046.1 ecotin [Dysgonomonas sp. PF1-16]MDH6379543.1 ecotin [Dysgonomonas sp. PFB1-18]MDH6396873.1 ecotin [Dysgonomonas sp. PF1-23]
MKQFFKSISIMFSIGMLMSFSSMLNAQDKLDLDKVLKPFPAATEELSRYVIELEPKQDESLYQVELIPGKVMSVDCNRHRLSGFIAEMDLEGWGYNYYEFTTEGEVASTMMACFGPKEDKFVTAETLMVRYNSKLPIVVYAPKGYEIKYRIWSAVEGDQTATQK